MTKQWLVGLVVVVALVGVGGIGYAAFTSTVTLSANGNAGTLNLEWACIAGPYPCDSSSVGIANAGVLDSAAVSYAYCNFTYVDHGFGLDLNASNLAPGDSCTMPASFGGILGNFGSLPATLTATLTSSSISCGYFTFSDNLFFTTPVSLGGSPSVSSIPIGAHSYLPLGGYTATLTLSPSATLSACGGVTDSATYTITATAGT
jgi:hypothetical protein